MKYVFLTLFLFFFSNSAFAYIDPGIGSLLVQSIIGAFAIGIGFISFYWNKFKKFLKNIFSKKKQN